MCDTASQRGVGRDARSGVGAFLKLPKSCLGNFDGGFSQRRGAWGLGGYRKGGFLRITPRPNSGRDWTIESDLPVGCRWKFLCWASLIWLVENFRFSVVGNRKIKGWIVRRLNEIVRHLMDCVLQVFASFELHEDNDVV